MFKELFESQLKDVKAIFKKKGQVDIINDKDLWITIDDIEGDIGLGMDQFENDVEINLKKDNYDLVGGQK